MLLEKYDYFQRLLQTQKKADFQSAFYNIIFYFHVIKDLKALFCIAEASLNFHI